MNELDLLNTTVAWQPQSGPQTLAIQCPATELMIGGAVGGGKTDFLLGDFGRDIPLGAGWQGIYFRKYFPDMDRVIQRSKEIFAPIYGIKCYSESKYQWNFPTGATLRFRALEKDNDVLKYQGQDYCVAKDSQILMGDGSHAAIQDINVGDMVMTLEGPKAVTATHGPLVKECVEAVSFNESGNRVGSQFHPADHPILTASGDWASYESLSCSRDDNKPTQSHECRKSSSQQDLKSHGKQDHDRSHQEQQRHGGPSQSRLEMTGQQGSSVSSEGGSNYFGESGGCTQETQQPLMLSVPVVLLEPDLQSNGCAGDSPTEIRSSCKSSKQSLATYQDQSSLRPDQRRHDGQIQSSQDRSTLHQASCEISCGQTGQETTKDSQCDCSFDRGLCDEQPLAQKETGQCGLPSRGDVAAGIRIDHTLDGSSTTQASSLQTLSYSHPYTGEKRKATEPVVNGSCEMTPCGKMEVYDLTVDKVAHYVCSSSRIISRNSWIGFDELTQWQSEYAYSYLFAFRLRSAKGVKVRMRCSSNPGGPGMQWVKARFIDAMPPGTGLHVKTKNTSYWRVFIPSRLEDNKILMESDPGYADRIMEFSDKALAKAMREGDWDSIPDAAFTEFDKNIHVIDPAPIPTDRPVWRSMDWGFKTPYSNLHIFLANDGDIIVGNEIYGWSGKPNVGTEEYPDEVRKKISMYERANDLYVPMGYLDNQCWEQKGQAGTIYKELCGQNELVWKPWKKGPNSRVLQKQGLHDLMKITNGRSRLKIMRNCTHLIRTLPLLPVDKNNIEDINTDAEDHSYDALRGGLYKHFKTKRQIQERAIRRRIQDMEYIAPSELQYGGC